MGTIGVEVGLPIATYCVLRLVGVSEAWSLVGAGALTVVTAGAQWAARRRVGLLGVVILVGFLAAASVAFVTDDPVAVFMVDPATNVMVVVLVVTMMATRRPFVARIRRDFSPDPALFDRRWQDEGEFRRAHRQASWVWATGLTVLALIWTAGVAWLPFDAAVGLSRVVGGLGYATMIIASEVVVRRAGVAS